MISSTDRDAFDDLGHLTRRGLVPAESVDRIVDALMRSESESNTGSDSIGLWSRTPVLRQLRLLNAADYDDAFLATLDLPAVLALADALVPAPYRVIEVCGISRRRGPGVPLHSIETAGFRSTSAGPQTSMLKVAIALSDIGAEDGPLVVFDGSHKLDGEFPYDRVPPDWQPTGVDAERERAHFAYLRGRKPALWEDIPGFRQIELAAGDAAVFTDDLWHGTRALRSDRTRRMLCLTYAPYHFANLGGVDYSSALIERASQRQRQLLSGPFHGTRYPAVDTSAVPEGLGFGQMPDSAVRVDF